MYVDGGWPAPQPTLVAASPAMSRRQVAAKRQDELLDLALEETFPASDPVSVARIS